MLIRRSNSAAQESEPFLPLPAPEDEARGGRQAQDGRYAAPILLEVERWIRKQNMSASRFGRLAASDPRLVADLRAGRDPSSRTVARIRAFMDRNASQR